VEPHEIGLPPGSLPQSASDADSLRLEVDLASTDTEAKLADERRLEEDEKLKVSEIRADERARRAAEEAARRKHPDGKEQPPRPKPDENTSTKVSGGDDLLEDPHSESPTPAAASSRRIDGSIDPTSVRESLASARDTFTRCLDADMKLELEMTITPAGDVIDASATSSAPDDVRSRDCVVTALRRVRFQPFSGTDAARISLGLALRR